MKNQKWIILLIGIVLNFSVRAQISTTDSARKFINANIRNSAVSAFQNLRLNTILYSLANLIDSAKLGTSGTVGVDTVYAINDTTARYKRNGVDYYFSIKGIYDSRRKVDTLYQLNDSTIRAKINGDIRDVVIRGSGSVITTKTPILKTDDSLALSYGSTSLAVKDNKLVSKVPVFRSMTAMRAIPAIDVDTGFSYKLLGARGGEFVYDPDDASSVDDSAMVIVNADGDRFKRDLDDAIYPEWFGAVGDGSTDDSYAFQKMIDWVRDNGSGKTVTIQFKKRHYRLDSAIVFPVSIPGTSQLTQLKIIGNGAKISTHSAISIFYRLPTDNSHTGIANYRLDISGLTFEGNLTTGQIGINIAGQYGAKIHGNIFALLDTGVTARFWLGAIIENNFFQGNKSAALVGSSGQGFWSGGSLVNSAFNCVTIRSNRVYNALGSFAAFINYGGNKVVYDMNISEGAKPRYHYILDRQGSTLVNETYLNNLYIESVDGDPSTIIWLKTGGTVYIGALQRTIASDTLFKLDSPGSNSVVIFDMLPYLAGMAARPFNALGVTNTATDIYVTGNNPDAGMFMDSTKWVGGILGANIHIGPFREGENFYYRSNKPLIYQPSYFASASQRATRFRSNLSAEEDNIYTFGGEGATNRRFTLGVFGDYGINIASGSNSKIRWLSSMFVTGQDLALSRDAAGVLEVEATGGILGPIGTTAQRPAGKAGHLRYNSDSAAYEIYTSSWQTLASRKFVRDSAIKVMRDSISVLRDSIAQLRADIGSGGGGGPVVNTIAQTLIGDDDINVSTDKIILFILVKPTSNLTAFKVGTLSDSEALASEMPVAEDVWTTIQVNYYLDTSTDIYFAGVSSSTDIKIVYKSIVE